jgi:ankyrin repeat protein
MLNFNDFLNAAESGELQIVKDYISQNHSDINKTLGDPCETALMIAVYNGNEEIVTFLISKGAKLDIDGCESSVLMTAYLKYNDNRSLNENNISYQNIIYKLIDAGANISVEDVIFGTLLIMECSNKNANSDLIEKLIEKGGSDLINKRSNFSGDTALMNASGKGHEDIVTKLIDGGANINATNNREENALMKACEEGHVDIVEKLLEEGSIISDINATNYRGYTAYMIAHDSETNEENENDKVKFETIKNMLKNKGADDKIENMQNLDADYDDMDEDSEYDGRKKSKSVIKRKKSKSVIKRKKSKSVIKRKKSKSVIKSKKSKSVIKRKKSLNKRKKSKKTYL